MVRPRRAASQVRANDQDLQTLSMRLCAWEPIAEGRVSGRIRVSHVRGALIDLGVPPTDDLLRSIYDIWFGQWMVEKAEIAGEEVEQIVHVAANFSPRSLRPRG